MKIAIIDCCAVNHRDCFGESNRVHYSYHSGRTDDVQEVFDRKGALKTMKKSFLKGFKSYSLVEIRKTKKEIRW